MGMMKPSCRSGISKKCEEIGSALRRSACATVHPNTTHRERNNAEQTSDCTSNDFPSIVAQEPSTSVESI